MYDLLVPNSVSYTETHPTSLKRNRINDNSPRQELSILRIVQERLTTLGLAQLLSGTHPGSPHHHCAFGCPRYSGCLIKLQECFS